MVAVVARQYHGVEIAHLEVLERDTSTVGDALVDKRNRRILNTLFATLKNPKKDLGFT